MIRFLFDEHVSDVLRVQMRLRAPELEVYRMGEPPAPPLGTADPVVLSWCEQRDAMLITINRASMPVHLSEHLQAGGHVPGILTPGKSATFGQVLQDLLLIALCGRPDEYRDTLVYLPLRS
ncbi:MAG TPA: hypothetical protein VGM03_01830 [Phycisphaerae bacterium]